jgi:predicted RNA-binding Zn ribbon-like protein
MGQGKTAENAEWKVGFLFLGNHLALDLLNTRPAPNGEPIELLSNFSELLKWFQSAKLLNRSEAERLRERWGESARGEATLQTIHELRETLREEILRWERGGSVSAPFVQKLNVIMARHPMRTKLIVRGRALAKEMRFEANVPENLLAPLAHSAAALITEVDRSRVRKCANCVGHFLDTSKKGTRRWCSMKLCGNRYKVAAYAARRRGRVST